MTAEAEHGQTPRGAPSPANHQPHMKLRSTASTLARSHPDFLNSLSHQRTSAFSSFRLTRDTLCLFLDSIAREAGLDLLR